MGIIKAKNLVHEFIRRDEEGNVESINTALDHVNLDVKQGQFIAILGHNGSGKSTLAKHINALLTPSEGVLWVDGMDVLDEENTIPVRKTAGMVFQNPDNQIIASVVEEDVGFGPENIGVPTEEIWERVGHSLEAVGMTAYRYHSPNRLSGGQKQRISIARVFLKNPPILILDEATSALDNESERIIQKSLEELSKNRTCITIAHRLSTIRNSNEIVVLDSNGLHERGTQEELMELNGTYARYYQLQFEGLH